MKNQWMPYRACDLAPSEDTASVTGGLPSGVNLCSSP